MGRDLIHVLDQVSREKGIEKDVLIDALKSAILSVSKKSFGNVDNLRVNLDSDNGELELFKIKKIVDSPFDNEKEIALSEAKNLNPDFNVGDEVEIKQEGVDFGRIAAQTAKQIIIQKVKEAERENVYKEYKNREDQLISGIVNRYENKDIIIDLGKTEGILKAQECIPNEIFKRGDRIRAYILNVRKSGNGQQLILSRAHPHFVLRLFEMEVPEISERIVEIKGIVREAGGKTKIAVLSNDKDIDPVGACVGMKGIRVQSIVRELRGEKIDIIRWSDDSITYVTRALSPSDPISVNINQKNKNMEVVVSDKQLSLGIGKKGQNVRLAAKLTGWKIDINSESEVRKTQEKMLSDQRDAEDELKKVDGIGEKIAVLLVKNGLASIRRLAKADVPDITEIEGIGVKKAEIIIKAAQKFLENTEEK
ncbi:MAG: transcription termination factor NusA [bacterium]